MALLVKPSSHSHRSKVLHQLFSKNFHWLLAVYAILTSVILLLFVNKFSSTDMCTSTGVSLTSGRVVRGTSSLLYPVVTPLHNVSNPSSFLPFSTSSKINIWDLFVPEQSCTDLTRVGGVGDGGKFVCGLSFLRDTYVSRQGQHHTPSATAVVKPPARCVVYSYGVSTDSSFEMGMLQAAGGLPCDVHAFDPTIGKMNLPSEDSDDSQHTSLSGGSITFHKLGLAAVSGTSTAFMLVENLFDTMHRLNHSFIDVLKIDVEGAEWDILPHLLQSKGRNGTSRTPVFGQLLIELHYQTVPRVFDFFSALSKHGFASFSREINLQPTLTGQLPLAVEYSFIHSEAFFDIRSRHSNPPSAVTPTYHTHINAVIYFLTQKKRTHMMASALQGLYTNFVQQFPQYPVLIFHDDLDAETKDYMQQAVPHMPLTFVPIVFSIPTNLQAFTLPERLPCSPHSSTIGYRHMISFHATLIHQYLFDPQHGFQDVEFLLRLDDDSSFSTPIGYDMFLLMRENKLDFGFVNTVQDDAKCVHGLWNHTLKFMQSSSSKLIHPENKKEFLKWKEGLVIYNNFELSRVSIWKTPLWRNYMESIEKSGGIYLKRWGDAPIHTIYVLLGVPLLRMHAFVDIAYRHDPFANQSASGLPKPKSNPFALSEKCVYYDQWRCGNFTNSSNQTQLVVPPGPLHPLWSPDVMVRPHTQTDTHTQTHTETQTHAVAQRQDSAPPLPRTASKSIAFQKKIIYTFAHSDRTHVLADTIANIFQNYAKMSSCGFIIFHFASFNESCVEAVRAQWRTDDVHPRVKFVQVASSMTSFAQYNLSIALPSSCGARDPELFLASRFLIAQAAQSLRSMGYEWFFRIADDSKLSQPVSYDMFDRLNQAGKRYGFSKVVLDNEVCLGDLWPVVVSQCQLSATRGQDRCSPLLKEWPTGVVVMTNFEVSHYSLWESPVFRHVVLMAEQALHNGGNAVYWGDAAIHTVGMLAYLHQNEVEWFGDVKYSARMNMKGNIPSLASPPSVPTVAAPTLVSLNQRFQAQRFGWLGGDVAASCALPSAQDVRVSVKSTGGPKTKEVTRSPSRYIWLFGDSLIGTSTTTRRLEGEMVSNSVAIVDINTKETNISKRIDSVQYFWRPGSSDGFPSSIFSDGDLFAAYKSSLFLNNQQIFSTALHARFWPFTALAVSTTASTELKLLVIGQLVKKADGRDGNMPEILQEVMGGLSFVEISSMAAVVHNPYDAPSMWRTTPLVLNFSSKYSDRFRWVSMTTLANKGAFARDQDFVYIFCSYNSGKKSSAFDGFILSKKKEYNTLLRIPAKEFIDKDFSSLETLFRDDTIIKSGAATVQWRSVVRVLDDGQQPCVLSEQPLSEPSFFFDYKRQVFTIVASEMSDSFIQVCRSPQVEGPYNCVHASPVQAQASDESRIMYAAKAHPELSGGEEAADAGLEGSDRPAADGAGLVVSYIINTANGPLDLFENNPTKDLYVPLFVNILDSPSSTAPSDGTRGERGEGGVDHGNNGKATRRSRRKSGRSTSTLSHQRRLL